MPSIYVEEMPRSWEAMKEVVRDVRAWLEGRGISDGAQYVAEVVLEEMLANAVEHGGMGEISVSALVEEERIELCFEDTGPAFDPGMKEPRFPEKGGGGQGGLGLHHVRTLARSMDYERSGGRNVVTISVDRWSPAPGPGSGGG